MHSGYRPMPALFIPLATRKGLCVDSVSGGLRLGSISVHLNRRDTFRRPGAQDVDPPSQEYAGKLEQHHGTTQRRRYTQNYPHSNVPSL